MKQVIKKGCLWLGLVLSLLVIPIIYRLAGNSKTIVNNINQGTDTEYKASVSDVIEQKIFLEEPMESLTLYISLEEKETNEKNEKENELKNTDSREKTSFTLQILGLDEEEHIMEFYSASPNTMLTIPISKHNDKEKWVTVKITIEDIQSNMELKFPLNSSLEFENNAIVNGQEMTASLEIKYVQKASMSISESFVIIAAVLFLIIFYVWYMIKNKENKWNTILFTVLLFMEILLFNFYENNVHYQEVYFIKKFYWLVVGMLFAIILGLFWLLKRKAKLEWVTTYCLFGFGLVYLLILPAFSAPDEINHFAAAYKVSNQMLLQQATNEEGYVLIRVGDAGEYDKFPGKETYKKIYEKLFDFSNTEATLVVEREALDAGGGVLSHLPGAIGITVARLLKLNKSMLLILGRLMGLMFYCFCLYWAVKKMPFGKMVFFVVSMFPMMLEESSSFGYDLMVNGCVFFTIAYIANLIYEKEQVTIRDIVIVSLLLFTFAPCKIVYIFVAGMWILIPKEKFINKKMKKEKFKLISTIIIIFSILAPNILINLSRVSKISSSSGVIFWANERGYGISDILENIPYSIYVFLKTLIENGEFYLKTLVGQRLGWLEIPVSQFTIMGFLVILFLEFFRGKKQYVIKSKERICYGSIAVVISLAIIASMWLAWTPISYDVIEGVQGRYFLPVIPLIYLTVANNEKIKIKSDMNVNIIMLCLLNVYAVLDILTMTFSR